MRGVITFIAITVASDIGGYVAGVLFGKHPMAPVISPKKSWEGFAGSLVATTAVGVWPGRAPSSAATGGSAWSSASSRP